MNKLDRMEIFKAINCISKKVNSVEQKLDTLILSLNADCNNKISTNGNGIDDMAEIVSMHDQAIDELATLITESGVE